MHRQGRRGIVRVMSLRDQLGRELKDLRISVTDRCNFRCRYCMPKEVFGRGYAFLERSEVLTFEEMARLARIFADLGVEKIRLTGGEPLLRRELPTLVRMISQVPGIRDIALTTNGALLASLAAPLREAGLRRITVSLDALDEEVFAQMSDVDFPVDQVLEGIEAARVTGFDPIKINVVLRRGVNEEEIRPLVRRFAEEPYVVRFIEYMDVGSSNGWKMGDVVRGAEVLARLEEEFELEALDPAMPGETARRFRIRGGGEIGFISSVTAPFCGGCTRARLTADGQLYTCLFGSQGVDLRTLVRSGVDDEALEEAIKRVWESRSDRYSELRTRETVGVSAKKVEMSRIGG